jgi:transcriptional regulator with XRE-family HTH domain
MDKQKGHCIYGETIKFLREKRGWTQKELSKHSQVPYSTVRKLENNVTTNPTISTIGSIAECLESPVERFMSGVC